MIDSITVHGEAIFDTRQRLDRLSQINLVFGSNGTGKTTISRVIDDVDRFNRCHMTWTNGIPMETFVYNRDFIAKHFEQSNELPGVFTLGDESVEIQQQIEQRRAKIAQLVENIANRMWQLEGDDEQIGKKAQLENLEEQLTDDCWKQKIKHDGAFQAAFTGSRSAKKDFRVKVLQVWREGPVQPKPLVELKRNAATVFAEAPAKVRSLTQLDATKICKYEADRLLSKQIRGKEDVSLAELIEELENSDWVREGVEYHEKADGTCPFCQRETPENFTAVLANYFDETFEKEKQALESLYTAYSTAASDISKKLAKLSREPHQFLDLETFDTRADSLKSKMGLNIKRLEEKRKAPSTSIQLDPLGALVAEINKQLEAASQAAAAHNKKIANLKQERKRLTKQVWQYVVHEELKVTLKNFERESGDLRKAIESMETKLSEWNSEKRKLEQEIRTLEGQTTGTKETLESINGLLERFDFITFSLRQANTSRGYRLVRDDGSDASPTLSEGEKTFVTFLYFYNLLSGSLDEEGITSNRVVVFDDPVSSLDSDVLFIVSTLIRELFEDVRSGDSNIKQIFVLTHNTYFHKEIAFGQQSSVSHYVVRKFWEGSKVEYKETNPVKTTYQLLWAELRSNNRSTLTIRNTMRRILEYYFQHLGQTSFNDICDDFDGSDQRVFRTLISWVHAGSHAVLDDPHFAISDNQVDHYLDVFRRIFEAKGHSEHYKMMMQDETSEDGTVNQGPAPEPSSAVVEEAPA